MDAQGAEKEVQGDLHGHQFLYKPYGDTNLQVVAENINYIIEKYVWHWHWCVNLLVSLTKILSMVQYLGNIQTTISFAY